MLPCRQDIKKLSWCPASTRGRNSLQPTGGTKSNEAVVSFDCGAGVQAIAERFPTKPVYAALDTQFLGILEEQAPVVIVQEGAAVLAALVEIAAPSRRCGGPRWGRTSPRSTVRCRQSSRRLRLSCRVSPPDDHLA